MSPCGSVCGRLFSRRRCANSRACPVESQACLSAKTLLDFSTLLTLSSYLTLILICADITAATLSCVCDQLSLISLGAVLTGSVRAPFSTLSLPANTPDPGALVVICSAQCFFPQNFPSRFEISYPYQIMIFLAVERHPSESSSKTSRFPRLL